MSLGLTAGKDRMAARARQSPVSASATILTFVLLVAGLASSIATQFNLSTLPDVAPLVVVVLVLDVIGDFVPQTRIVQTARMLLYGILYLVITVVCGVLAAYAMQRFAFPLQDDLLARVDRALGLDWAGYAHWVDGHATIQSIFHFAYWTISPQIALPVVVFAFANRLGEARAYLLAFAIAFVLTIFISALVPAVGPEMFVDRTGFDALQFSGATPYDHMMQLRASGPLVMTDPPGGIGTFPSFHATVAILTPLALRGFPRLFIALIVLNAAMLGATVSEGAHYFSDVIAGSLMAVFAYAAARRLIAVEDRVLARVWNLRREDAVQAA
jgi:membrane-associated phospholipid phosphatase